MNQRKLVTTDRGEELLPEVDTQGTVIGPITRSEAHGGSMRLHPVVHLHVFDAAGRLYLQQRASWKTIQPLKWDTACGGHFDYGETPGEALAREVWEELDMDPESYHPTLLSTYVYESPIERELVYVYTTIYNKEPQPSPTETAGGRFWTASELCEAMGKQLLTPMFETEYQQFIASKQPWEQQNVKQR